MMSTSDTDVLERLHGMDDRELQKLVSVDVDEYREDVVDAARAELLERGLPAPTAAEFLGSLSTKELQSGPLFCVRCYEATTDERFPATGETFFRRLIELEEDERCPECGSALEEHCVIVLRSFVITRLAQFRVKRSGVLQWPSRASIIASRKVRG